MENDSSHLTVSLLCMLKEKNKLATKTLYYVKHAGRTQNATYIYLACLLA